MRYSLFKDLQGKVPLMIEKDSWDDFVMEMVEFAEEEYESKDDAMLMSSAIYGENSNRNNDNVIGWDMLMLDIDSGETPGDVRKLLKGLEFFMYNTASSSMDEPKFRIILPFTTMVDADIIPKAWYAFVKLTGLNVDIQCKDKSRIYYLPGQYETSSRDILIHEHGEHLNVIKLIEAVDMSGYKEYVQNYIDISTLKNYSKNNLDSCLFIKKSMIDDYLNLAPGEDQHYRAMYKFMLRVAGAASRWGYYIEPDHLGALASELDLKKDGRWNKQGRLWIKEAQNAVDRVYGKDKE